MLTEKEINKKEEKLKRFVINLLKENEKLSSFDSNNDKLKYVIDQEDSGKMIIRISFFIKTIYIYINNYCFHVNEKDKDFNYLNNFFERKKEESSQKFLKEKNDELENIEKELKKTDKKLIRKRKLNNLKNSS